MARFCNLRSEYPFHPPASQTKKTTMYVVSCALDIINDLEDWYDETPSDFRPTQAFVPAPTTEVLTDTYHVYPDLWTVTFTNAYRTYLILLHEVVLSQLAFLHGCNTRFPPSVDSSTPNPAPVASAANRQHDEIDEQMEVSRSTIQQATNDICASVPYHLNYDPKSYFPSVPKTAAAEALVWPLYVCSQLSPKHVYIPNTTRSWMVGRLQTVGAETGVMQATMLAQILLEKQEVTDLLVDE